MTLIQTTPRPSNTAALYTKLTLVALMWGGTFVAGRAIADHLEPLAAASGRFGIAVIFLLILARHLEGGLPRLTLSQFFLTLGLGATGVVLYNLFFFGALAQMPASRTALFVAFNPIAVAVVMAMFGKERLGLGRITGIFIALLGALVVISNGEIKTIATSFAQNFGLGEMFMCGAVLSWVAYTVLGRRILGDISPLAATTYASLWGFVFLSSATVWAGAIPPLAALNWDSVTVLFYLAIGGTVVPFVWYFQGVQELGAGRAAVFTNLVPFFGVVLGFLILNEPLSGAMLWGGALIILGVTITNASKR